MVISVKDFGTKRKEGFLNRASNSNKGDIIADEKMCKAKILNETKIKKHQKIEKQRSMLGAAERCIFQFIHLTVTHLLKSNIFWWLFVIISAFSFLFFFKDAFMKKTRGYFAVKKVEFEGNKKVPEILLLKLSKIRYKESSLTVSLRAIKEKLEKISWVKGVVVQRKLPGKISIRIAERTPIAILQTQNKLRLVDSDGVILDDDGIGNHSNLPIIAGDGAESEIFSFLQNLEKFPKIRKQLIFSIRVGRRRWDIRINRGVIVKLPERGLLQAFGILDELSDSNGFFNKDIACLDLRNPDKIIISKRKEVKR